MEVHFFEEYPQQATLAPAGRVDWPATVLLAAADPQAYAQAAEALGRANPRLTPGWWPTLPTSYWLSAFADPAEVDRLAERILELPPGTPVLLDLEPPLLAPRRLLASPRRLRAAVGAIDRLVARTADHAVLRSAELPGLPARTARLARLRTRHPGVRPIVMHYTSLLPARLRGPVGRSVHRRVRDDGAAVGLGTIATGVLGNEPILTPRGLARDMVHAAAWGAGEVWVFRLGGLTVEHAAALREGRRRLRRAG